MEELRRVDDALVQQLKAAVCAGLQIFETRPASQLYSYGGDFQRAALMIVEALESYVAEVEENGLMRDVDGCSC